MGWKGEGSFVGKSNIPQGNERACLRQTSVAGRQEAVWHVEGYAPMGSRSAPPSLRHVRFPCGCLSLLLRLRAGSGYAQLSMYHIQYAIMRYKYNPLLMLLA